MVNGEDLGTARPCLLRRAGVHGHLARGGSGMPLVIGFIGLRIGFRWETDPIFRIAIQFYDDYL